MASNYSSIKPFQNRFLFLSEVELNHCQRSNIEDIKVLFLADVDHPANVVQDHINSIAYGSSCDVTVVNTRGVNEPEFDNIEEFDVVLVHYSIYLLSENYISREWQNKIAQFSGLKAVIHEDEYQFVNQFKHKFKELGIKVVFSCLDSPSTMQAVYDGDLLSETYFFSCLPGYVASDFFKLDVVPLAEREFDIVYRGRQLPSYLGLLGQEKRIIGEQILSVANDFDLKVNISSEEDDRIYGEEWTKFLSSGKAMLGVEGGATIFDFEGNLPGIVQEYEDLNPEAGFLEVWKNCLCEYEGNVSFKTITPKFFEAIANKTALVLYPGLYNGILRPNEHYIVLERDGSNMDEVVRLINDLDYLTDLTERTYSDVLSRNELQTSYYSKQIDAVLTSFCFG